jgi:ATP-dependent exoDNAse (exonuclease V) beta subunit
MDGTTNTQIALEKILERTRYFVYLKQSYDEPDANGRIENIKELLAAISHFTAEGISSVKLFLDEIALMQEKLLRAHEDAQAILLMTLHAAKGLEFDTVILAGVEENIIPTPRSLLQTEGLEEERRLFYVGITRARKQLLITYAKNRYTYGSLQGQLRSRFLDEIPQSLIPAYDCNYWDRTRFIETIAQWTLGKDILEQKIAQKDLHTHLANKSSFTQQPFARTSPATTAVTTVEKKNMAKETSTNTASINKKSTDFYLKQAVDHATYGPGTICAIEEKMNGIYVTVQFKTGMKKILSSFLIKL